MILKPYLLLLAPFVCGVLTTEAVAFEEDDPISMRLELEELALPVDGMVTGELIFVNDGPDTCGIGGNVSLDSHCGSLRYELERPDGTAEMLVHLTTADKMYKSYAWLYPGDWVKTPVVLLRLENKFIFRDRGTYRIRAVMKFYKSGPQQAMETVYRYSNWVEFRCTRLGPGHNLWCEIVRGEDVFGPSSRGSISPKLQERAVEFEAYQREVEKFLIYRPHFTPILVSDKLSKTYKEARLNRLNEVLTRACRREIGVKYWQWIVEHAENENEVKPIRKGAVRNGYLVN